MSPTLRPPAAHTLARRSSFRLDRTDLHKLECASPSNLPPTFDQTPCLGASDERHFAGERKSLTEAPRHGEILKATSNRLSRMMAV